jgi:hypothetical protein
MKTLLSILPTPGVDIGRSTIDCAIPDLTSRPHRRLNSIVLIFGEHHNV